MVASRSSTRIEGAEGHWHMDVLTPPPHLAGWVKALTFYGEHWPQPVSRRQVATTGAVVFWTWGAPMEVSIGAASSSSYRGFVAGIQDRPARTAHDGTQGGIGVHLSAPCVSAPLGVPGAELANRCVGLHELFGHGADALADQLSVIRAPIEAAKLVETALAGRLGTGPPLATEVLWAWKRLRCQPSLHIADLAAEVGWSRTRLASRFREQIGISPKRFARVVRFEEVCRLLACGSASLAELATGAGYFDHAHLCREASALAGELALGGPSDP